ncbi:MAG: PilZ domain-containing protein [Candidatus Firestonebacteria bacterium]
MYPKSGIEKRKHLRISTIILADLYALDRFNTFLGRGCITNVSTSGMQIETKDPITASSSDFLLKFSLPNGTFFDQIRGRIMRVKKDTFTQIYGIRFTRIHWKDKFKIWWFLTVFLHKKTSRPSSATP